MAVSVACDSYYYGRLTSTAYNFLQFNVISGQSSHFGVNSPFNYVLVYPITQMMTLYPFLIFGAVQDFVSHWKNKTFPFLNSAYWSYVIVLSMIGHKENRFMLPLFQIGSVFVASAIVSLVESAQSDKTGTSEKKNQWIFRSVKLALIIRVIISATVWLHLSQYNNMMYKSNEYIRSLEPKGKIFISSDYDSRPLVEFDYKDESGKKLLMYYIEFQFTERTVEGQLKSTFISSQNGVTGYLPSLIPMIDEFEVVLVKHTLGSIVNKKVQKYMQSKGFKTVNTVFNRIADGQLRPLTKNTGLMYRAIYAKT